MKWSRTLIRLFFYIFLIGFWNPASSLARTGFHGLAPKANDDFRRVGLSDVTLKIDHSDLLTNDLWAVGATLREIRSTVYGRLDHFPTYFVYTPADSFWAVGSDSMVYEIETDAGTSMATLHLVTDRPIYSQEVALDFETAKSLPDGEQKGLGIEGDLPLIGSGSLWVTANKELGDVHSSIVIISDGTDTGEHEEADLDLCAGGLANIASVDEGDVAGYLVLLGSDRVDISDAVVRVGLSANASNLFVEVKEVDSAGHQTWHRSPLLVGILDTVHMGVSYRVHENRLVAMLRANGLAVRSNRVDFRGNAPTHVHLGFFHPPGSSSSANLLYDQVRLRSGRTASLLTNALFHPLQMADDFEKGNFDNWTNTFGTEHIVDRPSALTGDGGLGVIGFSGSPSYVSFRPTTSSSREISAQARIGLSSFAIASGTGLAAIAVMTGDNPWFSSADYQLRLGSGPGGLLASIWYRQGQHWIGSSSAALDSEQVVRLQMGKSDGPNMNNGWMRLWRNGEIVIEQLGLANDSHVLRNVLFGGQSLSPNAAWGTLRFDDVSVTR